MADRSHWYGLFRRIGRVTLVILKIILLFLEAIKRFLEFE